jgi:hypothetical protein
LSTPAQATSAAALNLLELFNDPSVTWPVAKAGKAFGGGASMAGR